MNKSDKKKKQVGLGVSFTLLASASSNMLCKEAGSFRQPAIFGDKAVFSFTQRQRNVNIAQMAYICNIAITPSGRWPINYRQTVAFAKWPLLSDHGLLDIPKCPKHSHRSTKLLEAPATNTEARLMLLDTVKVLPFQWLHNIAEALRSLVALYMGRPERGIFCCGEIAPHNGKVHSKTNWAHKS